MSHWVCSELTCSVGAVCRGCLSNHSPSLHAPKGMMWHSRGAGINLTVPQDQAAQPRGSNIHIPASRRLGEI